MVPEFALPQFLPQSRKLLKQLTSRDSLQILDYIRNGEFGRSSHETMYMIAFAAFKHLNSESLILRNLLKVTIHSWVIMNTSLKLASRLACIITQLWRLDKTHEISFQLRSSV